MLRIKADRPALLVESMHQPQRSTVAACLDRWFALSTDLQMSCYLVVEGEQTGTRTTFDGQQIRQLCEALRS